MTWTIDLPLPWTSSEDSDMKLKKYLFSGFQQDEAAKAITTLGQTHILDSWSRSLHLKWGKRRLYLIFKHLLALLWYHLSIPCLFFCSSVEYSHIMALALDIYLRISIISGHCAEYVCRLTSASSNNSQRERRFYWRVLFDVCHALYEVVSLANGCALQYIAKKPRRPHRFSSALRCCSQVEEGVSSI